MSGKRTRLRLSSLVLGALAFGALFTAPSAFGDDLPPSGETVSVAAPLSPDIVSSTSGRKYSQEELDDIGGDPRVAEYWTPERMAEAIPVELPVAPDTQTQEPGAVEGKGSQKTGAQRTQEAVVVEPAEATDSHQYAVPKTPSVTNFSQTNGKVFYLDVSNGLHYVCSGSSINSGSRRLVSTAGHCVYGDSGVHAGAGATWHQHWIFVPAYWYGNRPYGTFGAKTFRTFADWVDSGESGRSFNSDVAFVTTYSNASGSRVVNAVGGHGLWSGGNRTFDVSMFGYPKNLSNGQRMVACWGTSESRWIGAYHFSSISGCEFGGGASGGPWLYQYSNSSGLGYLRTVSSFGPENSAAYIAGPYFDARVVDLYNEASGD